MHLLKQPFTAQLDHTSFTVQLLLDHFGILSKKLEYSPHISSSGFSPLSMNQHRGSYWSQKRIEWTQVKITWLKCCVTEALISLELKFFLFRVSTCSLTLRSFISPLQAAGGSFQHRLELLGTGWYMRSLDSPLYFSLLDALTGSGESVTLTVIHHVSKYVILLASAGLISCSLGDGRLPKEPGC